MDWIDDNVAIGSTIDARCVRRLRRESIDLIIDSRTLFSKPTILSNEPNVGPVMRAAQALVDLSALDLKVLLFCRHGKDRSPFVAAIYLTKKYGVSCEEAYGLIRNKRPRIVFHPEWVEKVGAKWK